VVYQLSKHQTVENIAVVVGRKLDYNRKEIHGTNIKINIEVLDS
jgi:hypothetical protein